MRTTTITVRLNSELAKICKRFGIQWMRDALANAAERPELARVSPEGRPKSAGKPRQDVAASDLPSVKARNK